MLRQQRPMVLTGGGFKMASESSQLITRGEWTFPGDDGTVSSSAKDAGQSRLVIRNSVRIKQGTVRMRIAPGVNRHARRHALRRLTEILREQHAAFGERIHGWRFNDGIAGAA